jgi:nucleotide-binding universal stress UspA family protein
MAGFKNILLFVDSNTLCKEACERAITLTAEENARLTILNVIEAVPERLGSPAGQSPKNIRDIGILERCEKLKELVLPKQANLQFEIDVVCGNPLAEVMQQVLRGRHDLVLVAEDTKPSLDQTSFGSTTLKLIRKCPCPVWVIGPSTAKGEIRIMAAVDPDPFDAARDALNTKILDIASSLAGREGTELHIVNAWRAPGEGVLRSHGRLSAENLSRYAYNVFNVQASSVKQMIQDSSATTVRHRMHLMKGTARKVIPMVARGAKIDLLVVGMFSRRGLGGWLIGNTAEKILNQVKCSVLMVKPNGAVGLAGKPSHYDVEKVVRINGSSTDKEKVFSESDIVTKRGTYNE